MNKENNKVDQAISLIDSVIKPVSSVKSIIEHAKRDLKAEDVRFRLKDWRDQSVVYVPNWIIGDGFRLDEVEPELARRVYFDREDPSRIDCIVGLVARIARIKEEEGKEKTNNKLLRKLKKFVSESEINHPRICFNNIEEEEVFRKFIDRIQKEIENCKERAKRWGIYLNILLKEARKKKKKKSEQFFSLAFSEHSPWRNEENSEKKEQQWSDLKKYLSGYKKEKKIPAFLVAVKKTKKRYELLYEQWGEYKSHYTSEKKSPRCEIAVPVVAFGRFLGVLNCHRINKFTKKDEQMAKTYAAQLATACLHRQSVLFEEFQKVASLMAAESNFQVIASKIAEGIRIGLRDGLKRKEVFPLLYVANQPISRTEKIFDEEFAGLWKKTWENSYYKRQKPELENKEDLVLWNEENKLGPIPIRPNGLGWAVIEEWKKREEQNKDKLIKESGSLFIDSCDVDDPNSVTGSRSAFHRSIKSTGCLPLIFEHGVYGLLYLHCKKRHFFTDAEIHALETSSVQAAIAINNARLIGKSYEELYGNKILEFLLEVSEDDIVSQKLKEWAYRIKDARGEVIAEITTNTIKDLCGKGCFDLPYEFINYIKEYKRREGALQSIADYREHFIHPFHVFLVGYYILNCWGKMGIKPLKLFENKDKYISMKTWFITSIYHDVGYPAEKLEVLVRDFFKTSVGREMKSHFDWSSILLANDNITHIDKLSEYFSEKANDQSQGKIFEKWLHKRLLEDHDHGVITALMLCSNKGWKEDDLKSMVYDAALAIALHSWRKPSASKKSSDFDLGSLAIEDFPSAFFLSYCDSAQEWGRRVLLELMKKEIVLFDIVRLDSRLEDIQVNNYTTKVKIKYLVKKDDKVVGHKTLKKVFEEVEKKFESTWHLQNESTMKFIIDGIDIDGHSPGSFGPTYPLKK